MRKIRTYIGRLMLGTLVAVSLSLVVGFSGAMKGSEALASINDYRQSLMTEYKNSNQPINYQEVANKVKAKAEEMVNGVEANKIDPAESFDWGQVFNQAGKPKDARDLYRTFVSKGPNTANRFTAEIMIVSTSSQLQDSKGMYEGLKNLKPDNKANALLAANYVASFAPELVGDVPAKQLLALMDKASKSLKADDYTTDQEKRQFNGIMQSMTMGKVGILKDSGKKDEALKLLDEQIAKPDMAETAKRSLRLTRTQMTLEGSPVPALNVERSYGTFPGWEGLKGKVVVLDYFAHWCPPCKAEMPDMRKMVDDLKPQGLEVFGVTTYYGYFDKEKNLSKDDEYARMDGFLKQFNMNWPVLYGDRTNFDAVGVTGIPHLVVVDRKGVVRKIEIGYSPELWKSFRAYVEKLLKE